MSTSAEARSILGLTSSNQARQQIAEAVEDALSARIARDLGAFVEQLVAIVRTEADARAAEFEAEVQLLRTRLDERAQSAEQLAKSLAEAQSEIEQARGEARDHAGRAAALQLEHDTLVRARTLAEEAWEQVEAESHRLRVSFERRIRELEAELSAQRGVGSGRVTAATAPAPIAAAHAAAATPVSIPEILPAAVPPRSLTLVEPARRQDTASAAPSSAASSELDLYVTELIDQLKTAYAVDLAGGLAPTALVDRLMANLRDANGSFAHHMTMVKGDARLLDRRLTELMDAEAATSFGRHLAVALYVVGPDQAPTTGSAS